METTRNEEPFGQLKYVQYEHSLEQQYLPAIRALISKDLSEPYSIYVYRYFLYQWGHLCFLVCGLPVRIDMFRCPAASHRPQPPRTLLRPLS